MVLDERSIRKIFWPAESRIKLILRRAGSNCKTMVVFDCCRENFAGAKERVIEAQKKTSFSDEIESLGKNKETEIDDGE